MKRLGLVALFPWLVLLAGCPDGTSPGTDAGPPARTWRVATEGLPGVILSFWGSSPTDVFAAGGPLQTDGGRALVVHYDGTRWTEMAVPGTTLWWVHGFAPNDVWGVGERGNIVHYDGTTWTTVEMPDEPYTLWGVWGASPSELWAVGGVSAGGAPGVLRRYDGTTWTDVTGVGREGELFFKVWGVAANDVWIVGTSGVILHYDGSTWTRTAPITTSRLLTVRGRAANDVWAVGGVAEPVVLHWDGTSWSNVPIDPIAGLMGVWTATGQPLVISGWRGLLVSDEGAGWAWPRTSVTSQDLHAVWGDGTGRFYAGGGNLSGAPPPAGIIVASDAP